LGRPVKLATPDAPLGCHAAGRRAIRRARSTNSYAFEL